MAERLDRPDIATQPIPPKLEHAYLPVAEWGARRANRNVPFIESGRIRKTKTFFFRAGPRSCFPRWQSGSRRVGKEFVMSRLLLKSSASASGDASAARVCRRFRG